MPPADLAALLAEAVGPELKPDLINLIAAYIADEAEQDDTVRAYWIEVHANLTKNDE